MLTSFGEGQWGPRPLTEGAMAPFRQTECVQICALLMEDASRMEEVTGVATISGKM